MILNAAIYDVSWWNVAESRAETLNTVGAHIPRHNLVAVQLPNRSELSMTADRPNASCFSYCTGSFIPNDAHCQYCTTSPLVLPAYQQPHRSTASATQTITSPNHRPRFVSLEHCLTTAVALVSSLESLTSPLLPLPPCLTSAAP